MKKYWLNLFVLWSFMTMMVSCTVHPFTYANVSTGKEITSLGASLLTKTKHESAFLQKGDLIMAHNIQGKSEVTVPNTLIWASALSKIASEIANSENLITTTSSEETITAINATKEVELAKEATAAATAVVIP